jgi:hypothetical protein
MNGKELKILLPLAVVVILILSVVGVLLMAGPSGDGTDGKDDTGPYTMSVGPILDEDGNPMEGVVITLEGSEGTLGSEVTSQDGIAGFSFDEKVETGDYNLIISKTGYEDNRINVSLELSDNNIVLYAEDIEEQFELQPEELPPLGFTVGPIRNLNGSLKDVRIELKQNNTIIAINNTNESGMASFIFETPPEDGIYFLNISFDDYHSIEREIIIDYDELTRTLSVIGNFDGITLELIKPPEPPVLPPVGFSVGPINGEDGILVGAKVELKFGDLIISTVSSDENGIAEFSFETPPNDGKYLITISVEDYEIMDIDIIITYNEEAHTLIISGEIIDISLTLIKPPKSEDNPDYYKELDAYKEFEDAHDEPVDVESMLDEDSDGTPEYYLDIENNIKQDVGVEEYVSLDANGNPEYSPEITSYEPLDHENYLARQARSDGPKERSGSRNPVVNLTHFDDMVDKNKILYNGTEDIMNYDTKAVNFENAQEFSEEVSSVGVGNPERVVTWKFVYKLIDRNGDNKTDKKVVGIQIFEMIDNNSNGVFEHGKGFQAVLKAYDNDYNGQFEDVTFIIAFGEQADIDGNITSHFVNYGVFYNHTIDKNNDSNYEFQRAAIYIVQRFDNNSNGNFELKREFAGGFEGIDNNSNGKYEKALVIWGGSVKIDKKDNGNPNINVTKLWIYIAEDQNEDKNLENASGLIHLIWNFDNNSNPSYMEF